MQTHAPIHIDMLLLLCMCVCVCLHVRVCGVYVYVQTRACMRVCKMWYLKVRSQH